MTPGLPQAPPSPQQSVAYAAGKILPRGSPHDRQKPHTGFWWDRRGVPQRPRAGPPCMTAFRCAVPLRMDTKHSSQVTDWHELTQCPLCSNNTAPRTLGEPQTPSKRACDSTLTARNVAMTSETNYFSQWNNRSGSHGATMTKPEARRKPLQRWTGPAAGRRRRPAPPTV